MTHLLALRRTLTGLTVALAAAFVLIPHAPAAPVAVVRPSLSLSWTPQLAARFPGCHARASGVAAAFVVVRLDGTVQRMGFDTAWKRTHDRQGADDIWTVGQCR